MKKLKMFGIKKDDGRAAFVLEKNGRFAPIIIKILEELTGGQSIGSLPNFVEEVIEDNPYIKGRNNPPDIKGMKDICIYRKYDDYDLEIFMGERRIILVIRSSLDNQKIFIEKLLEIYELQE